MKKFFAVIMIAMMVMCFIPSVAFGESDLTLTAMDIYVSSSGDDVTGDGTQSNPYASLAKAAEIVNAGSEENYTVHVLSDLTSTACARFYNKNVTIIGDGETAPVVTRGDGFETISDNARSWYNPAMIEVGGTQEDESGELGKATLYLKNIILNDAGKYEGEEFNFAKTDGTGGNEKYVQDAIIASYNGTGTIILGEGTVLKNFGGMTAVYITGSGKLTMENGSTICDDDNFLASKEREGKYPVLLIGATLEMDKGSYIMNIKRALSINSIGAKCSVNGTIEGINGEGNPLVRIVGNSEFTLGETGNIENNITNSIATAYIQSGSVAHFYGKITGNKAPAGAIFIVTNGGNSYGYLYDGAEIINNESTGKYGVIEVQQGDCTFTMNGGTVSGNKAKAGAIQVRKGNAKFIMNGGIVDNNELLENGTGDAGVFTTGSGNLTVSLNKGILQSITIDSDLSGKRTNGHVYIARGVKIKTGYLTTRQDGNKTISQITDGLDIKLSNASKKSVSSLSAETSEKGWSEPLATFWMQRSGAATLNIGRLNDKIQKDLPVYAMALPVGEDGNPIFEQSDATVSLPQASVYAADVTENGITFTVPEGNENGYAIALVQPTTDFGNVIVTTAKDELDADKDKNAEEKYEIPYTATYNMSDSLKSIMENAQDSISDNNCIFSFIIELDKRLTAKNNAEEFKLTSPILEAESITASEDGHTVTAVCKLKNNWQENIDEAAKTQMVLKGIAILEATDFAAGDTINTTANVQAAIHSNNNNIIVYVPGNVCKTLMVKNEKPVDPVGPTVTYYSIKASAGEGGTIAPTGYVSVLAGTDKTFAITPAEGYEIKDVLVDGVNMGVVSEYTFKTVLKNHTIEVAFQEKQDEPTQPTEPTEPEKPTKPEKPIKPDKPAKPVKPDTQVPKTGDMSFEILLLSIFALVLSAAAGLIVTFRKKVLTKK